MTPIEFINDIDLTQGLPSWAELELKAMIYGIDLDILFCRHMLAFSRLYEPIVPIIAEGILSSIVWNCCKNNTIVIDDILRLQYIDSKPKDKFDDIINILNNIYKKYSGQAPLVLYKLNFSFKKKYLLFDAFERRFPLLLIKYYAANSKQIHLYHEYFAIWLKKRMLERSQHSEAFSKIYKSMEIEFSNNHMSNTVFMN